MLRMGQKQIRIGDGDAVYANRLADKLKQSLYARISVCYNGADLFTAIEDESPDLVIMELILQYQDGLSILEKLTRSNVIHKPKILVHSALSEQDVVMRVYELGADFLKKSADEKALMRRIERILKETDRTLLSSPSYIAYDDEELHRKIGMMLQQLGFSPKLRGYRYLWEGIALATKDGSILERCTTELYPYLADCFQSTPNRVERCMRYSIESAFERGNLKDIEKVFGYTVDIAKGKPTNSEFIAMLADRILIRR